MFVCHRLGEHARERTARAGGGWVCRSSSRRRTQRRCRLPMLIRLGDLRLRVSCLRPTRDRRRAETASGCDGGGGKDRPSPTGEGGRLLSGKSSKGPWASTCRAGRREIRTALWGTEARIRKCLGLRPPPSRPTAQYSKLPIPFARAFLEFQELLRSDADGLCRARRSKPEPASETDCLRLVGPIEPRRRRHQCRFRANNLEIVIPGAESNITIEHSYWR